MIMKNKKIVVFDLDDTLMKEIDYLKSAYREIAVYVDHQNDELYEKMFSLYQKGENVFSFIIQEYSQITIDQLLNLYRNHLPDIHLADGAITLLNTCKKKDFILGLITDGRSITQRNKLKAVGIESYFNEIIISEEFGSEKPDRRNFKTFDKYEGQKYYIADNTAKDFVTPNKLGWTTICVLDNGQNIHEQKFSLSPIYLPEYKIASLEEVEGIIFRK